MPRNKQRNRSESDSDADPPPRIKTRKQARFQDSSSPRSSPPPLPDIPPQVLIEETEAKRDPKVSLYLLTTAHE
jgi:hypothetical protein